MRTLTLITLLALTAACRDPEPADNDGDGSSELLDCNDADATVFPGATELCNGVDDDCSGDIDEDAADATTFFRDGDGDGVGSSANTITACDMPSGYTDVDGDCDDARGDIHPGAPELDCTDATDYNCDGSVGYADDDGDGFAACQDCDDTSAAAHPGAAETCNDADDDCDGSVDEDAVGAPLWYADADADGFGAAATHTAACSAPQGYVADATDCNDASAAAHPGLAEVCDGIDNDCNSRIDEPEATDATTWYADSDNDGHGDARILLTACAQPASFVTSRDDCDDADATSFPGGTEVCDGADNDCDGTPDDGLIQTWYADADGDGHGSAASALDTCAPPSSYVSSSDDCDDADATSLPGGTEVCDGADNDCDGTPDDGLIQTWYADGDGDGYGLDHVKVDDCRTLAGFATTPGDCDDVVAGVNPGATEICNSIDDDCDGLADDDDSSLDLATATSSWSDLDLDGFGDAATLVQTCVVPVDNIFDDTDCDDTAIDINPLAAEIWYDGVDQNCDGADDYDQDGDGHRALAHGGDDEADTDPTCWTGCIGGLTQDTAGDSCLAILTASPSAPSDYYWVDTDADGDTTNARQAWCDMDNQGGGWTQCFTFVNTPAEDLIGNSWFDQCVDDAMAVGTGTEVRVVLHDNNGVLLYDHFGTRPSDWTYDNITSTIAPQHQYLASNHSRLVSLDNADKLMITGRYSANTGWGGSYGNGYGITVYPTNPNYAHNPKMFVGSYMQTVSYIQQRQFVGFTESGEISGTGNASYDSSVSTPAQLGTFAFYVR